MIWWELALAGCQVFEDLSAQCWSFIWVSTVVTRPRKRPSVNPKEENLS